MGLLSEHETLENCETFSFTYTYIVIKLYDCDCTECKRHKWWMKWSFCCQGHRRLEKKKKKKEGNCKLKNNDHTGTTQRDCMAKPIQYCKVINLQLK